MRWRAVDRNAGEPHRSLARTNKSHDGLERRAFAHAVAAEQADHLAGRDVERHAVKDMALAVIGVHVLDTNERRGTFSQSALSQSAWSYGAHVFRYTSSTFGLF